MFHVEQSQKHQVLKITMRQLRKHKYWIYKGFCGLASATSPTSSLTIPTTCTHLLVTWLGLFLCLWSPAHLSGPGFFPVHRLQLWLSHNWEAYHEPSGCAYCQLLRSPSKVLHGDKVLEAGAGGGETGQYVCMVRFVCPPDPTPLVWMEVGGWGRRLWENFSFHWFQFQSSFYNKFYSLEFAVRAECLPQNFINFRGLFPPFHISRVRVNTRHNRRNQISPSGNQEHLIKSLYLQV